MLGEGRVLEEGASKMGIPRIGGNAVELVKGVELGDPGGIRSVVGPHTTESAVADVASGDGRWECE